MATSGIQYALSKWHSARVITGPDKSVEKPALETMAMSQPRMRPSSSKPTS